jgi:hypothetical protein
MFVLQLHALENLCAGEAPFASIEHMLFMSGILESGCCFIKMTSPSVDFLKAGQNGIGRFPEVNNDENLC